MDLKPRPISLRPFCLSFFLIFFFFFALYFNRIKTTFFFFSFPQPQRFYFALFLDEAASEIKDCVLSSRFVENTLRSLSSDVTSEAL